MTSSSSDFSVQLMMTGTTVTWISELCEAAC